MRNINLSEAVSDNDQCPSDRSATMHTNMRLDNDSGAVTMK